MAIPDSEDFAELDKMVNSLMEKSENYVSGQRKDGKRAFASICKLCGKEGNGIDIKRHIEANHLEGTSLVHFLAIFVRIYSGPGRKLIKKH